jgi:hypothetical protein
VDQYGERGEDTFFTAESIELSWRKVGGVCHVSRQEAEDPGMRELFYTRGTLKNRFNLTGYGLAEALDLLRRGRKVGFSSEDQQTWAKKAGSYNNWYSEELKAIEQAEASEEKQPASSVRPQPVAPAALKAGPEEALDEEEPDEEEQRRWEEEERRAWEQAQEEEQREEEEREYRAEVARDFWSAGGRPAMKPHPRPEDAALDPPKAPWCCHACGQWIPAMSKGSGFDSRRSRRQPKSIHCKGIPVLLTDFRSHPCNPVLRLVLQRSPGMILLEKRRVGSGLRAPRPYWRGSDVRAAKRRRASATRGRSSGSASFQSAMKRP